MKKHLILLFLFIFSINSYAINIVSNTTALKSGSVAISTVNVGAIISALPTGSNSIGFVTVNGTVTITGNMASIPTIYNTTCVTADMEYSQLLPDNTKRFSISVIDGTDTANYRVAFETGKVASPTSPYLKYLQNIEYSEEALNLFSKTIYFASSLAGVVIQIIVWN